ncbi:L,D-transpeptidase family protein [Desulforamulus hydrothermalis]|uniref:L,D-transpeptidase family protein n=1 Tax=Desulforamulus hydrothermalis TaxID=412895 RepID=UPI000910450C|nr:L,D-transpeptidase family protein [Desulforamulus hydrothermalis]SHH48652.1 Copper amine oxidase N-terminal domain-containing protein [Desulforamulus hydrothermalis Lam5 = DSM 18033]
MYGYKKTLQFWTTIILCQAMSFFVFTSLAEAWDQMIIINKKTNQLGFYQNGILQNVFPVATGRQRSFTPEGKFIIINKIVNPPYYKKNIPGGSPRNPLGPRWLGLSAPGGPFGIHGNNNPASIGTYASNGCIRLYNKDILWLYEQVSVGTPVIIVWNDTDFKAVLNDIKPIKIYYNQEEIDLGDNFTAFSRQNKPYLPLKALCRLLGYQLYWNSPTNTVDLKGFEFTVQLTPQVKTALLNGNQINLTDPPLVINGTTYITASTMKEIFALDVAWQPDRRELYLSLATPTRNAGINEQGDFESQQTSCNLQDN